jgi:hypothetical protein
MDYINNAVTVGLGYLVYKGIMSELAQGAVTPPITTEKWTGKQAQAKRAQIAQAEGWSGMFFRKGVFPESAEAFESGLKKWAGVPEGCTVSGGFQVNCPPPKGPYYEYEGPPQYCKTDWSGAKKCTTTPPTITMPLDMTGVTEGEVVAGIDWTGYENIGRFFK